MNAIISDLIALQEILERGDPDPATKQALLQPLRDRVPPAVLARFLRSLACGRRGVSLVRHGVCSECHIRVARATMHSLARPADLHLCESCGTLLMLAPEEMPEPVAAPTPLPPASRRKRGRPAALVVA